MEKQIEKELRSKLFKQCKQLGINDIGPNSSIEILTDKLANKLADLNLDSLSNTSNKETKKENKPNVPIKVFRDESPIKKANRLRYCTITCNNPEKAQLQGEIYTCANDKIGVISKYIKFNSKYFVPEIIYNAIKEKQFKIITTEKNSKGETVQKVTYMNEFNIIDHEVNEEDLEIIRNRQILDSGE